MPAFICIADGMSDFMPNEQSYHYAASAAELVSIINEAQQAFEAEEDDGVYHHAIPRNVINLWLNGSQGSWRVAVAKSTDRVLDVISMTADEFARESE